MAIAKPAAPPLLVTVGGPGGISVPASWDMPGAMEWAHRNGYRGVHLKEFEEFARALAKSSVDARNLTVNDHLDAGAFGSIHKGKIGSRPVAIKRVSHDVFDLKPVTQITRELCIELQVVSEMKQHSNVCEFVGAVASFPCAGKANQDFSLMLLYELCVNCSLSGMLYGVAPSKKRSFTFEEKVRIGKEIACGVAYLHSLGVLHRDLNPRNVLLTGKLQAKVCDFGFARCTAGQPYEPTTVSGTAEYMSPEHLMGTTLTLKSDVWSVGAILWELIVEQPPWAGSGEDNHDLIVQWVAREGQRLPMPSDGMMPKKPQGAGDEYCQAMDSTFRTFPENRPTMEELYQALRSLDMRCQYTRRWYGSSFRLVSTMSQTLSCFGPRRRKMAPATLLRTVDRALEESEMHQEMYATMQDPIYGTVQSLKQPDMSSSTELTSWTEVSHADTHFPSNRTDFSNSAMTRVHARLRTTVMPSAGWQEDRPTDAHMQIAGVDIGFSNSPQRHDAHALKLSLKLASSHPYQAYAIPPRPAMAHSVDTYMPMPSVRAQEPPSPPRQAAPPLLSNKNGLVDNGHTNGQMNNGQMQSGLHASGHQCPPRSPPSMVSHYTPRHPTSYGMSASPEATADSYRVNLNSALAATPRPQSHPGAAMQYVTYVPINNNYNISSLQTPRGGMPVGTMQQPTQSVPGTPTVRPMNGGTPMRTIRQAMTSVPGTPLVRPMNRGTPMGTMQLANQQGGWDEPVQALGSPTPRTMGDRTPRYAPAALRLPQFSIVHGATPRMQHGGPSGGIFVSSTTPAPRYV